MLFYLFSYHIRVFIFYVTFLLYSCFLKNKHIKLQNTFLKLFLKVHTVFSVLKFMNLNAFYLCPAIFANIAMRICLIGQQKIHTKGQIFTCNFVLFLITLFKHNSYKVFHNTVGILFLQI